MKLVEVTKVVDMTQGYHFGLFAIYGNCLDPEKMKLEAQNITHDAICI